jgi:hypothetical protein
MEGNSSIYWTSHQSRVSDDDATEISWARLVRLRRVSSIYLPFKSQCPVNSHPAATHNFHWPRILTLMTCGPTKAQNTIDKWGPRHTSDQTLPRQVGPRTLRMLNLDLFVSLVWLMEQVTSMRSISIVGVRFCSLFLPRVRRDRTPCTLSPFSDCRSAARSQTMRGPTTRLFNCCL